MPTHTTAGGISLYYEDRGRGTPLVLLHGFPVDHRMWDAQAAALAGTCRVITPDLRGFGRSPAAAGTRAARPFTVEDLADDVRHLLAAVSALPCVLGGLSMGGYVALAFARRYPADLLGLALLDTQAGPDSAAAKANRQKNIDLARAKGPGAVVDAMLPKLFAPSADVARPELAAAVRRMAEGYTADTVERAMVALRDRPDATPGLAAIAVPTLVVVGDSDQITPPKLAEDMRDGIVGATLAVILGAGHLAPVERPPQVSETLGRFARDLTSGVRPKAAFDVSAMTDRLRAGR
ncbi:MAG: catD [Phycisphaerales bacterium]|nr:catD [Phycisphaerales bacterium]